MRIRFDPIVTLGATPISEVVIPINHRDKLTSILKGLHFIFITPELNEKIFKLLEDKILTNKEQTGRNGMDLWFILVLGVIRVGMDYTYDEVCYAANFDSLLRKLLGLNDVFFSDDNKKQFTYRTIHENISKLDSELLEEINTLISDFGEKIIKKKKTKS